MPTLRRNEFKAKLREGRKQIGFWLTTDSLRITEESADAGFDWLLLDMEHSMLDLGRVEQHVLAAKGGQAELVVRVPSTDPAIVKRLLDNGVRSLMFPYVQTVEEAQLAASATRYPPEGFRGYTSFHRGDGYGAFSAEYLAGYADEQCIIVQAESPQAIDAIPAISRIGAIDAIFVGPNDLSFNMGSAGDTRAPAVRVKISEALSLIKAGGKAAGILNFSNDDARQLMRDGFDFVAVHGDAAVLGAGTHRQVAAFADRNG